MKIHDSKPSFAKGELSPLLAAREDLAAYMTGARELTNFIVLPQGGIMNRPGTAVIESGAALDGARLVPFVYSETDSCCLVFRGDGTVDVCGADGVMATVTGSHYGPARLPGLRWLQSANVLYLFHRGVRPYMLQRRQGTDWAFEPVEFKNGPYQDLNTDESVKFSISDGVLASGADWFAPGMVGESVRLEYKIKASSDDFFLTSRTSTDIVESEPFALFGASTITSMESWEGDVKIMRKGPDEEEYTQIKVYSSAEKSPFNLAYSLDEEKYGALFKIMFNGDADTDRETIHILWSSGGGLVARQVRITAVLSARAASVVPIDDIAGDSPETEDWAFGAFSARLGYPAMGIFHQERLILANTPAEPQALWMSKPASWHDFGVSIPAEDTDSITVTLAAKEVNEIRGLASRSDLLIFTGGAEWVAKAGSKSDVFTPSSVTLTPSGYRGSADIAPLEVGPATLFMQKHGKVVRGMGYQLDIDGYSASDLSILSEHLFEGRRAVRWAYQQEPWSVVWIVLDDGQALALTLQHEHQVTAWSRQEFSRPVRDVCVIPGDTQDDLFMLAGDGSGARLVMLCRRTDKAGFSPAAYRDEGAYSYVSSFESLDLALQSASGSIQGRHKHVPGACVRVYRTCGFKIGAVTENSSALDQAAFPDQLSPANKAAPYTGDVTVRVPGGAARSCRIRIENGAPQPVTVLGVFQEVGLHG